MSWVTFEGAGERRCLARPEPRVTFQFLSVYFCRRFSEAVLP